MRRIAIAAALVAVTLEWGCRNEGERESQSEPAGAVLEVSGGVTAARGGDEPRALDVDSPVYPDDVIETGTDGLVRIRLDHNGAVWELGAEERRRVDSSLAWKASEGEVDEAEEPDRGDERSVAAGRHAEAQAADTPATAPEETAAEKEAPTAAPPARVNRSRPRRARQAPEPEAAEPAPARAEARAPAADMAAGVMPTDAAPMSGLELQERVSAAVRRELQRCFNDAKAQSEEPLGGRVDVNIRVDSDGRFETVDLEIAGGELEGVPACGQRSLKRATVDTQGRAVRTQFSVYLRGE